MSDRAGSRERRVGSPGDEGGMTLMEVVVALLVLGIGLLAVAGMTLSVGTHARRAGLYTDQTLLAQERLAEASALGWDGLSLGTAVDTVHRNGTDWEVTREVTSVGSRLREVTVTVAVAGSATVPDRAFSLRLAQPRPLPQ